MKNDRAVCSKKLHSYFNPASLSRALPGSIPFAALLILTLGLFIHVTAAPYNSTCSWSDGEGGTHDIATEAVRYLPITGELFTNAQDPRTDPNDSQHQVILRGLLYYERQNSGVIKNRKVLVFNHGHEDDRPENCSIVEYFATRGWVVFMPLRRGYFIDANNDGDASDTNDVRSTGVYIDKYVEKCMRSEEEAHFSDLPHLYCTSPTRCRPDVPCGSSIKRSGIELSYLNDQRIDVRDQITYIKSLAARTRTGTHPNAKLADPKNIVIAGHSYGGSLIVFTNGHDYGQSVAISISGAELSWGTDSEPFWELDLMTAMQDQQRPIYFLQPKNGRFLTPMKRMFGAAIDNGFRSQASLFPKAPCKDLLPSPPNPPNTCDESDEPEWKQAHGSFLGDGQVQRWGPSVIEFAERYERQ